MRILTECFGFSNSKHKYSSQIEELCHRFSLAQLQKSTNNFDENRIIGRGGSSKVYKGCIYIQGVAKEVAIKRANTNLIYSFNFEVELLCQLHHTNLISLIGFCNEKDEEIIVYEYMPNKSLNDHLVLCDKTKESLPWKRRLEICIGAARGLHYLHSGAKRTILHRVVKPANILLDQNWIPKLSDFRTSLKGPHSMSKPRPIPVSHIVGTIGYMSPECVSLTNLTEKCDVYSFGMVLMVVVCADRLCTIFEKCRNVEEGGSESEHFQGSYENLATQVDEDKSRGVNGTMCEHLQGSFQNLASQIHVGESSSESEHLQVSYENLASQSDLDESEIISEHILGPFHINLASWVYDIVQNGKADEIVDPFLMGKIEPECWKMFMNIAERCLLLEPNERPTMGEVEVELEHALALQEEADQTNPSGDYSLFSTMTTPQPELAN
ncbi:hypothetical protein L6164_006663 [Bauhinia variegata]|uniref:Uncharacterized protein n=1 Tax=Bauhinia variegata TaxID=167791 RepID=A0ACB9PUL0_BAUVA|nr:hypothetical protein L6164_006663 [Bauhinia variegata]